MAAAPTPSCTCLNVELLLEVVRRNLMRSIKPDTQRCQVLRSAFEVPQKINGVATRFVLRGATPESLTSLSLMHAILQQHW